MAGKGVRLREKLFDDYAERLARQIGGGTRTFVCPICQEKFAKNDVYGENPRLTLAHVIPEALGGTFCTLACAGCNNNIGCELEAYLLDRFRAEDAMRGVGTIGGRLVGDFGSVGVEFRSAPSGEPWPLFIIEKQTNLAVIRELETALDVPVESGTAMIKSSIKPYFRHRPSRVSAALYQSAFLAMFAYFGYEFAFDTRYAKLRDQIQKPDETILPGVFDQPPEAWANEVLPEPHSVMMVKRPYSYILPVFRLRPKVGLSRVIGVPLPGLDDPVWPPVRPRGKVDGVLVRFRPAKDDGSRPRLAAVWEQVKHMP
ncbi:MAG: HNH endonuclease [Gemmataceae bacterium]|nr:HNH endonuclease [Gemmataceae bacterium]